jgi:methylated-DNA-protein-cysteine methyltransferase-like protein
MDFYTQIYTLLKTIPVGKVTTYGDIAKALGRPRCARIVGYALHVNPDPQNVPCYKVVNRQGKLTPSFAFGGIETQKELLKQDGIQVINNTVNLDIYRHNFNF